MDPSRSEIWLSLWQAMLYRDCRSSAQPWSPQKPHLVTKQVPWHRYSQTSLSHGHPCTQPASQRAVRNPPNFLPARRAEQASAR